MLDEEEFAQIQQVHARCVEAVKRYRKEHCTSLADTPTNDLFRPVQDTYAALTGTSEPAVDHILQHRIQLYGPPCPSCGKPLRTPEAKSCAACGKARMK